VNGNACSQDCHNKFSGLISVQFLKRNPDGWISDGVVGIATGYGLDDRESELSPGRIKNILVTSSRPVLGPTQPPIQWVPGTLFPGVKRPGLEADHSPPASAEVKKTWLYTSTPPYAFMA
jgi:hypothetical protein